MSALGFGLFVGSVATAVAVGPRAFREPGAFNAPVIVAGVLAWIIVPAVVPDFFGFLLGAMAPLAITTFALRTHRHQLSKERLIERERIEGERTAAAERRAAVKAEAAAWPSSQRGWAPISQGRLMHVKGQPKCFFMLSDNKLLVRIVEYHDDELFWTPNEYKVATKKIISLNIASPTVKKSRTKVVPVTVIGKQERSPVARGLLGGALLGPVGLVVGAASGLNGKITSSVQHETVQEDYEALGDPQLIIGTSVTDRPVLKIKFDPPEIADEWMFRIRGAQTS